MIISPFWSVGYMLIPLVFIVEPKQAELVNVVGVNMLKIKNNCKVVSIMKPMTR